MLVNVFSWRRVYIIGIALLMFLKKTAELGRRMCVYMCNSMHTRVCTVGLMYVHVYVTAPQSKWSLPHLIWWHHRANEGSLFVPSSHFTWWLHRTNEDSLFMPLPPFIWQHHRANEGSLFMPSPHFIWQHHRANEGSLFMPSPHFIWQHHRANEGSLFMPSPHFIWWHQSKMKVHCSCHRHTSFDGTRANEGSLFMPSPHFIWWHQSKWRFIVHAIATHHLMAPEQMKVHCSCHRHTSILAFRHPSSKFVTGCTTERVLLISAHLSADIAYIGLMVSAPSVKFAKSCKY